MYLSKRKSRFEKRTRSFWIRFVEGLVIDSLSMLTISNDKMEKEGNTHMTKKIFLQDWEWASACIRCGHRSRRRAGTTMHGGSENDNSYDIPLGYQHMPYILGIRWFSFWACTLKTKADILRQWYVRIVIKEKQNIKSIFHFLGYTTSTSSQLVLTATSRNI